MAGEVTTEDINDINLGAMGDNAQGNQVQKVFNDVMGDPQKR